MDLTDGFKKLALAAVGAGAITYEKTSQLVDQLVKKGEITVDQGKAMNQELRHNVKEAAEKQKQEFRDAAARARESAASKQAAEESKEDESRTVDSTATEVIDDAAKTAKDIIDVVSKLSADQIAAVKKVIDSLDKTETGEKNSAAESTGAEEEDTPKEDSGN